MLSVSLLSSATEHAYAVVQAMLALALIIVVPNELHISMCIKSSMCAYDMM